MGGLGAMKKKKNMADDGTTESWMIRFLADSDFLTDSFSRFLHLAI
jgi:hypothetical protein